jgi:hypothetical protein
MNYQKQAEDFLTKAKATIKIELAKKQLAPLWAENNQEYGLTYDITIERPNHKTVKFNFWDSIDHKNKIQELNLLRESGYQPGYFNGVYLEQAEIRAKIKELTTEKLIPTAHDILACITKYDPQDFENFCTEFGYNTDSRAAERIFLAVSKEWHNVKYLFNDVMEELRDID